MGLGCLRAQSPSTAWEGPRAAQQAPQQQAIEMHRPRAESHSRLGWRLGWSGPQTADWCAPDRKPWAWVRRRHGTRAAWSGPQAPALRGRGVELKP